MAARPVIYFNSKFSTPRGFEQLSNFYGGVEYEYMQDRFNQTAMAALFRSLEHCQADTFLEWLKRLQPNKKWTPLREKYWMTKCGTPIRGVLFQMLGTLVRNSATATERKRILLRYFASPEGRALAPSPLHDIETKEEMDDEDKRAWMKTCLEHKYADPTYRALLLSTGNAVLHERPMRGGANNWTYKVDPRTGEATGGDWLGQLLMQLRDEYRADEAAAAAFRQYVAAQNQ